MKSRELKHYVEIARQVALAGGAEALKYFRSKNLVVESKSTAKFDPVTLADKRTEEVMRRAILSNFPEDGIIGEEHENISGTSGISWVIDPIDGTRSFIAGAPTWGILVAVNDGIGPFAGVIYQPFIDELFFGGFGSAYYEFKGKREKIFTKKCKNLSDATLFSTFPEIGTTEEHRKFQIINKKVKQTRYGFDCYAYALLAMGAIDIVMEAGLQSYDIQGPQALIESSGGVVSSWSGNNPQYGGTLLACGSKNIHDEILLLLTRS